MKLNFEDPEMLKWNILTKKAQGIHEKNGILCLIIKFSPRVTVIKMLQIAQFFVFSFDDSKTLTTIWAKYLHAPKRS